MSRREAVQRTQNELEDTTFPASSSPAQTANAFPSQDMGYSFGNMRVFPEGQTESRESMPFNAPRSNDLVAHEAAHVPQNDSTRRKPRVEE